MDALTPYMGNIIERLGTFMVVINILIHFIFAGGVAKDVGALTRLGRTTALVTGPVWAFATLMGGVWVAVAYWIIHHSKITL